VTVNLVILDLEGSQILYPAIYKDWEETPSRSDSFRDGIELRTSGFRHNLSPFSSFPTSIGYKEVSTRLHFRISYFPQRSIDFKTSTAGQTRPWWIIPKASVQETAAPELMSAWTCQILGSQTEAEVLKLDEILRKTINASVLPSNTRRKSPAHMNARMGFSILWIRNIHHHTLVTQISTVLNNIRGTRHCATTRMSRVWDPMSDCFFNLPNPSGRTRP
jgi:hypothetical protein